MAKLSKGVLGKTLVGLPLLALASAAWIVTLAGLAISKHEGAESDLGFLWFIWALEGFVLGFCALHLVEVGAGYGIAHAATASLFAIAATLTILETEGVNQLRKAAPKHTKLHKGITCAFVGLLLLSVFNLLLVVVLGTDHNVGRSSHQQGQHTASQATGAQAYDAKSAGYGTGGANPATLV